MYLLLLGSLLVLATLLASLLLLSPVSVLLLSELLLASIASVVTSLADSLDSRELLHLWSDLNKLLFKDGLTDGHDFTLDLSNLLELLRSSLTLVNLSRVARKKNKVLHVLTETLNVKLKRLLTARMTTLVDSDTDGASKLRVDLSSLELIDGEATASTDAHVVATRGAADDGTELLDWAREHLLCLQHTSIVTTLLASSLVVPGAHTEDPMLMEMLMRYLVVMTNHLFFSFSLLYYRKL